MTQKDPSSVDPEHRRRQRRAFLRQAGVGAAVALGGGWAALSPGDWPLSLADPDGESGKPVQSPLRLPEKGYAVESSALWPHLGIARGKTIDAMVRAAVEAIGGMSRFVQSGDIVVIKPNVAFERAAALGATTNPQVLGALVRLAHEAGAKEVRVADNPIESPGPARHVGHHARPDRRTQQQRRHAIPLGRAYRLH